PLEPEPPGVFLGAHAQGPAEDALEVEGAPADVTRDAVQRRGFPGVPGEVLAGRQQVARGRVGTAALAGAESLSPSVGGAAEVRRVLGAGAPCRAAGAAIDPRRRDADDEFAVEGGIAPLES